MKKAYWTDADGVKREIKKVVWVGEDGVKRHRFYSSRARLALCFFNLLANYERLEELSDEPNVRLWRHTCEDAIGLSKYGANWDFLEDDCSESLRSRLEHCWNFLKQPVPSESEFSRQEFAGICATRFARKCFKEMEKRGTVILEKD